MFKHILVPTDATELTRNALDIAVQMYQQTQEAGTEKDQPKITLLHVIETIADDDTDEAQRFYDSLRKKVQKRMQALVQDYEKKVAFIEQRIHMGNRVNEILNFVRDYNVDLIILNSHRIDIENPAQGWGTISYKVGILSPCPVMLVK